MRPRRAERIQLSQGKLILLPLFLVACFSGGYLLFFRHLSPSKDDDVSNSISVKEAINRAADSISFNSLEGPPFVLMTAATYSYRNYVRNLACSLHKVGKYELLLVALDKKLYNAEMPPNVRSVLLPTDRSGDEPVGRFGTEKFSTLSRIKLAATKIVLETGFSVLYTDSDIVWCDSAAHELSLHISNSNLVAEDAAVHRFAINTGLYYARANKETINLFDAALNFPEAGDDQDAMNMVSCDEKYGGERIFLGNPPYNKHHPSYCRWNDSATVGFLPRERFPLGCTKYDGKRIKVQDSETMRTLREKKRIALLHYSCIRGSEKIASMKSHRMWHYNKRTGNCKRRP